MSEAEGSGSVLAWVIPPQADPDAAELATSARIELRRLTDDLETACRPESASVQFVPVGISRIYLHFADREAAFRAFDAASARVRAHPGVVCRVVATTPTRPVG